MRVRHVMPDIFLAMNHFKLCESNESPDEPQNDISCKLVGKKNRKNKGPERSEVHRSSRVYPLPQKGPGMCALQKQPLSFNATVQVPC